jgi:hypothetical protein
MIFRIIARDAISNRILQKLEIVGTEREADMLLSDWMDRYPDAKINYDEIEEELGVIQIGNHKLDGEPASLIGRDEDFRFTESGNEKCIILRVRLLSSMGLFRPGDVVILYEDQWRKGKST